MDHVSRGGERLTTAESLIRQLIENRVIIRNVMRTRQIAIFGLI